MRPVLMRNSRWTIVIRCGCAPLPAPLFFLLSSPLSTFHCPRSLHTHPYTSPSPTTTFHAAVHNSHCDRRLRDYHSDQDCQLSVLCPVAQPITPCVRYTTRFAVHPSGSATDVIAYLRRRSLSFVFKPRAELCSLLSSPCRSVRLVSVKPLIRTSRRRSPIAVRDFGYEYQKDQTPPHSFAPHVAGQANRFTVKCTPT